MTDRSASPQHLGRPRVGRPPERLWRVLLGEQLRGLRRSRQETLAAVAGRANLSVQYLSEVERGTKEASSEVVAAIGAALGITLLDLTEAVASRLRDDAVAQRRRDVALAS